MHQRGRVSTDWERFGYPLPGSDTAKEGGYDGEEGAVLVPIAGPIQ